tara:strand:+ start:27335 stop:27790 length:456 start_codon:yes stop_codon:yes gene_type:complete
MAINEEQFKQGLSKVVSAIRSREGEALLLTAKRLEGIMKRRIFNDGKATSGSLIGKYKSKSWKKKRSDRGRQVATVDLQFTGDLIRSFKTVRDGDEVVLAIVNDQDFAKAKGNERRRKKDIFEPGSFEVQQIEEYFDDIISDIVINEFNKI